MIQNRGMILSARQKKVYQAQDVILAALKKVRPFSFVLSGGTALSRFYFHHRFSEDLDFFFEGFSFSFEEIEKIARSLSRSGLICELIGRSAQPGRLKYAGYSVGLDLPIKIDFLEDPFAGMWAPEILKTESGVPFRVDSLDQIYYRKFFSVLEQWHKARMIARMKDLVDLYCLHRYHRSIEKTVELFRRHHVPIQEEKLIMIFAHFKKMDLVEGFKKAGLLFQGEDVFRTFRECCDNMVKRGLSR